MRIHIWLADITLVLLISISILACSNAEQDDWQQATTANNLQAYQRYLDKYPAGEYTKQARLRILVAEAGNYLNIFNLINFVHLCDSQLKFKGKVNASHFYTAGFDLETIQTCRIQGIQLSDELTAMIAQSRLLNGLAIRQACCEVTGYDDGLVMYFDNSNWHEPVKIGLNKTQKAGSSELIHKSYPRIKFRQGAIGLKAGKLYVQPDTQAKLDGYVFRFTDAKWRLDKKESD